MINFRAKGNKINLKNGTTSNYKVLACQNNKLK